jgi:ketosteroid isomerase-like protein
VSEENVGVVRKFLPPLGTDYRILFGDDVAWAAARESVQRFIVPNFARAFTGGGAVWEFAGLDGLRETFLDWIARWATYYDEIEEVFAVCEDRVVILARQHGRRLDTEAEVVAESASVYTVRDGKIARLELYATRSEALKAVGLEE